MGESVPHVAEAGDSEIGHPRLCSGNGQSRSLVAHRAGMAQ